jgi:hypothetical protein
MLGASSHGVCLLREIPQADREELKEYVSIIINKDLIKRHELALWTPQGLMFAASTNLDESMFAHYCWGCAVWESFGREKRYLKCGGCKGVYYCSVGVGLPRARRYTLLT